MICLLALVWIISCTTDVTGSANTKYLQGEIGGNVTFNCFAGEKANATFFYFQINETFINGYYEDKDLLKYKKRWNNTKLDGNTVHMYKLKVSDSGLYQCIMLFKNEGVRKEYYQLSVTAKYSQPTVIKSCEEGFSCFVTCASHGGYPGTEMTVNVPVPKNTSGQMWKVVNISQMSNPITMEYNSTTTVVFNCSKGQLTHISCSVGEVTSPMFSVCEHRPEPDPSDHTVVIIAICAVAVFIVSVGLLLYCRCKKRQQHRQIRNDQQMETLRGGEAEEGTC
ncbi:hypothetical protein INR49_018630 [Caranx melampygus]|nr:hypothetical protein INR49_018630 [Caranx melampygus]